MCFYQGVDKKWADGVETSATVNLLANGKRSETVKLHKGDDWKHTFKDLPKLDETGKEIAYTVREGIASPSTRE